MKLKGLGRICYLMSSLNENNDFLIRLINYQVKIAPKISVIVQDECFVKAQASFSKRVNLYNASMQKTPQSRNVFRAMLKVIQPDVVFVFGADANAYVFANYTRTKTTQIIVDVNCKQSNNSLFVTQDISEASKYIIDFLEKKSSLDFYPKHYIQNKAVFAQMKLSELIEAVTRRKKRVETAFEKEWGYKLPVIPETYNEILNRYKTLSSYKRYKKYVDKYKVRRQIHKMGYGDLLPRSLGFVKFKISKRLWDSLPNRFLIKPTNSSGLNIVVEDKSIYNLQVINRVIRYIKHVHYGLYKNEPVYSFWNDFLITEYISDITDYKFFCFNGQVEFVAVVNELKKEGENGEPYQMITDKDFNELPFSYGYERGTRKYEEPYYFNEMVEIAEKLSTKFQHVRIDMMGTSNKFYFGEFTFFPGGGRDRFMPSEYDSIYGAIIKQHNIDNKTTP